MVGIHKHASLLSLSDSLGQKSLWKSFFLQRHDASQDDVEETLLNDKNGVDDDDAAERTTDFPDYDDCRHERHESLGQHRQVDKYLRVSVKDITTSSEKTV